MNSRSSAASTVSCTSRNKNNFFTWILVCLLPSFLGTPIAYVDFQLLKAIMRCPSSSVYILGTFGGGDLLAVQVFIFWCFLRSSCLHFAHLISPKMVSSKAPFMSGVGIQKHNELLLPREPFDAISSDYDEFDFADVFGPNPTQAAAEVGCEITKNLAVGTDANDSLSNDPAVICNRSHSLVGPSSYVNQSLKLSKAVQHLQQ